MLVSFPNPCLPNGVYSLRELSDVIPEGYYGGGPNKFSACLYYPISAGVPTSQFGGRTGVYPLHNYIKASTMRKN